MAYRPRDPTSGVLHRLLAKHWEHFQRVYDQRFRKRFGPLRAATVEAARRFYVCGDHREGLARIACATCGLQHLIPFSCKVRGLCPSCGARRVNDWAHWLTREVLEGVAHRQVVLSVPKMLRPMLSCDPKLFGELAGVLYRIIRDLYAELTGQPGAVPGMVVCLATHGNLLGRHPHIHALVSEGSFSPHGTFYPVPQVPAEQLSELARRAILDWLVSKERLAADMAEKLGTWKHHGGFSVHNAVRVSAEDITGKPDADPDDERPAESLIRYVGRGPYSERKARLSDDESTFFYTSKINPGIGRNYEMLDPLEALARILSVVPPKSWQSVRYFGRYSNRSRGERRKRGQLGIARTEPPQPASLSRQAWAKLIAKIFKDDPSICERCGGEMRVVAFVHDRASIERLLRHAGMWREHVPGPPTPEPPARSPPQTKLIRLDEDGFNFDQSSLL